MKATIIFKVDADRLAAFDDQYIAQLWHVSQANPAPFGDVAACDFAEHVEREIVRRWLDSMGQHQARHITPQIGTVGA